MNADEAVLLIVDEYTRMAETYDARVVPRFRPFAERLLERAGLKPGMTILDVSTGTGLTALLAAKAVAPGQVVAIDLADGALAVAQTKAARAGLRNLRFEMLDSRNIVYRQQTFDVVVSSFGLPAIGHEQVLREILRVLKEGARFHLVEWAARDPPAGWDAFEDVLARHRTATPSAALAQLREASDLVRASGDFDAIRNPDLLTAKMRAAGFANVTSEFHRQAVEFPAVDDLVQFRAAFGTTEREVAEMGDGNRAAFLADLTARLAEHRHDDRYRFTWSVVYYEASR